MGIHKSLGANAKEIKLASEDIQVVTITFNKKEKENTLTVINVYDSPEESSYKKKKKQGQSFNSTIDELFEFFNENPAAKNCVLVGDLNARTGEKI